VPLTFSAAPLPRSAAIVLSIGSDVPSFSQGERPASISGSGHNRFGEEASSSSRCDLIRIAAGSQGQI
jgi:hypothetical protein